MATRVSKDLVINSQAFGYGDPIPNIHAKKGENKSPDLEWTGGPAETESYALIVDDEDKGFTHWVVYNIPRTTSELPGGMPARSRPGDRYGMQGKNDFGKTGWDGPDPPSGIHHYYFRIYALDTMLDLKGEATREQVTDAMKGHILATAELMGTYWK